MPLLPKAIYKDYINNDLEKSFAVELLLTLIDNAENLETRIESVNILDKIHINDEKTFKFLEHLLVSELNEDVRFLTFKVLKNNYLSKSLTPISWALEHESSLKCLIIGVLTIAEIDSEASRSYFLEKLNKSLLLKNKFNLNKLLKRKNFKEFSNKKLAEIIINNFILSFLHSTFGVIRFKVNDSALITDLDLSNVESFDLSLTKLERLLDSILSLDNIKNLDLRFNHLTKIPEVINNSIENIDFSYKSSNA